MMFRYTAYTNDGAKKQGVIDAETESSARKLIQAEGLFVSEISNHAERSKPGGPTKSMYGSAGSVKKVASFTRQMSVMISSGTPIVQSLEAVERQTADLAWKAVITEIRERVEEGSTLSDAMAHHPKAFDAVYRAMISAGESGGDFDMILKRLSKLIRQEVTIRNNVTGAMVYPALLMVVAAGVMVLLSLTVLPRFKELFETLDAPLPVMTAGIMAVSDIVQSYWWAFLAGTGAFVFGMRVWLQTERGKITADTFKVRMPIFGKLVREFKTAKISRVLGVLLEARVPLLESLEIARGSANNKLYMQLVENAVEKVEKGESMSDAFSGSPLISSAVCEAIRNGEQTGRVGEVLMNLADIMDEDNDLVIRSLTSILEPVILSILGVVVGIIALSLFLPLFDLTASTGAG